MPQSVSRRTILALGSTTAMAAASQSLLIKEDLLFGEGFLPHSTSFPPPSAPKEPRVSPIQEPAPTRNPLDANPAGPATSSSSLPPVEPTPPSYIPGFAQDYWKFLADNPLRHITPEEIIRPHLKQRSGVPSGIPPRSYWKRILPTLRVADEMRDRLGVPLERISSAYRSPAYNARCPGSARRSQHTMNRALDLIFGCSTWSAYKVALQLRKEGMFSGGIGRYSSFIHIDTRGIDATWRR